MNLKNLSIWLLVFWVLIPFIFINDMYPFYRFGMFAEIPQNTGQTEMFEIRYYDLVSKVKVLNSQIIGFEAGHFSYIIRSYYYQQKIEQFFSQIHQILKKSYKIKSYELRRISIHHPQNLADTIVVASWKTNE